MKTKVDTFLNMDYKGSSSDVIDQIDYNRKKTFEMLKINDPNAYEGMNDQIIVMDIFKKGIDAGRIEKIEEKELDKEFKEKKYKWEDFRKIMRDVVVKRELKEGVKTNYQENDTKYIDRNKGRNPGKFERRGRERSRSNYRGGRRGA